MGFLNKDYKVAKQFSKEANAIGAAGIEAVEAEKARTIAAETSRQRVFGMLGAPGTYDLPGTGGSQAYQAPTGDIYQSDTTTKSPLAASQFKGGGYTKEFGDWESRAGILDPEKFAEDTSKSASFRIQSRRTAEAEQLLAQEGPMWDQLSNSVYGVINEGAATQLREDVRALKTNAAKGGTARRTALAEAQQMQAQESANQMRVQQTWKANLALFDVVRQNADNVQKGNYSFIDNLPGIQAAYQSTMSSLANMLSSNALPMALEAKEKGMNAKLAHPKVSIGQRIIGGVIGAAMGYASGGGLGAVGGALAGAVPEANPNVEQGMAGGALGGLLGGAMRPGQPAEGWQRPINPNEEDQLMSSQWKNQSGAWNTNRAYQTASGIFSSIGRKLG